jgi:IMP dehydrogenase
MNLDDVRIGLTFDDVLIVPARSGVRSRGDVSLRTQLSRNVTLEMPVVAANMDTVCEW